MNPNTTGLQDDTPAQSRLSKDSVKILSVKKNAQNACIPDLRRVHTYALSASVLLLTSLHNRGKGGDNDGLSCRNTIRNGIYERLFPSFLSRLGSLCY